MNKIKISLIFLISLSSFCIADDQYEIDSIPSVTLREKVDTSSFDDKERAFDEYSSRPRSPSSNNTELDYQSHHWKIQEVIDRFDKH